MLLRFQQSTDPFSTEHGPSKPWSRFIDHMSHWNPLQEHQETWVPVGGWNASFSEMDRIQGSALFAFFTKKGCRASVASTLANMVIYKQKNHGLRYSEEQESLLQRMMQPIIR